jgi:hypothetical protein
VDHKGTQHSLSACIPVARPSSLLILFPPPAHSSFAFSALFTRHNSCLYPRSHKDTTHNCLCAHHSLNALLTIYSHSLSLLSIYRNPRSHWDNASNCICTRHSLGALFTIYSHLLSSLPITSNPRIYWDNACNFICTHRSLLQSFNSLPSPLPPTLSQLLGQLEQLSLCVSLSERSLRYLFAYTILTVRHSSPPRSYWDNSSNWDVNMIEMCAQHQAIRDKRVGVAPPDLMAYVDLKKETAGSRVWASGTPQGELSFDPLAVREHFFKAQAALCLYANGCTAFT